jgi:hypothetical protein
LHHFYSLAVASPNPLYMWQQLALFMHAVACWACPGADQLALHRRAAGEKHLEAYALFSRALERISSAEARLKELPQPDAQLAQELAQLGGAARAWRCAAHAELAAAGLAAQAGVQEELDGLSLQEGEQVVQQVGGAPGLKVMPANPGAPGLKVMPANPGAPGLKVMYANPGARHGLAIPTWPWQCWIVLYTTLCWRCNVCMYARLVTAVLAAYRPQGAQRISGRAHQARMCTTAATLLQARTLTAPVAFSPSGGQVHGGQLGQLGVVCSLSGQAHAHLPHASPHAACGLPTCHVGHRLQLHQLPLTGGAAQEAGCGQELAQELAGLVGCFGAWLAGRLLRGLAGWECGGALGREVLELVDLLQMWRQGVLKE